LIYAVTGVDFLGVVAPETTPIAAPTVVSTRVPTGNYEFISVGNGVGAQHDFWQVYFTAPLNTNDRSQWVNGIDVPLANAIDATQNTLDIAAFELNNETISDAILRAHERGVQVRIVTDDEHGLEDDDSTLVDLELEGIPIVDDDRTALMHNKFMIMDGITVWTGSTNFTQNGIYRNNNNLIALRSRRAVIAYQAEFDEMFLRGEFGPTSSEGNSARFTQDGVPIEIYFAAEDDVVGRILAEINSATSTIRFMVFSFTRDDIGEALLAQAENGIDIQGVFETTGSETEFSEMPRLLCAGLDVRQDGNRGVLHHKVFIIDENTVVTGSFNFSNNATQSNDENLVIIRNADIAELYLQEFDRVRGIATVADDIPCD
jgi:phosphatidylserine/phosphatidylglycerophosphate/cardiolipin synthase-like enzyme